MYNKQVASSFRQAADFNSGDSNTNLSATNSPQLKDEYSRASISGDTVKILGQTFPLGLPHRLASNYYPTGELNSFAINPAIIDFRGRQIPIRGRIDLHKSGIFQGSFIDGEYIYEHTGQRGYTYKHQGQEFAIDGDFSFYESGSIESFYIYTEDFAALETKFLVAGKKLLLFRDDKIIFYEASGLPKKIIMNIPRSAWPRRYAPRITDRSKDYNVIEISETGEITAAIMENRPNYDF